MDRATKVHQPAILQLLFEPFNRVFPDHIVHYITTVQLPSELMDLVDEIIRSRKYGYRSRAEFVAEAFVRSWLG